MAEDERLLRQIEGLQVKDIELLLQQPNAIEAISELYTAELSNEVVNTAMQTVTMAESVRLHILESATLHQRVLELQNMEKELLQQYEQSRSDLQGAIQPFSRETAEAMLRERVRLDTETADALSRQLLANEGDPVELTEQFVQAKVRVRQTASLLGNNAGSAVASSGLRIPSRLT